MLRGKFRPPPGKMAHEPLAVKWARHASTTPTKKQADLPRLHLDRQVCGYATLGQICYFHPTRDDRDRYLSRLQRQIDDLAAGPLTADSEKVLEGLTELHECVSLLPTSSIGWSDESYPTGDYNDECAPEFEGYDDEYVFPVDEIDMDSHCDDYWLEEDSSTASRRKRPSWAASPSWTTNPSCRRTTKNLKTMPRRRMILLRC